MTAATADRLTADQQAQAVSQWGRAGSFRCCACDAEATVQAPAGLLTATGLQMGVCHPCTRRMRMSPAFRREARARAEAAALRSLWQRVADLAGVTNAALLDAFRVAGHRLMTRSIPTAADVASAELRLGLPPGSVSGALLQVFSGRARQ